MANTLMDAPDVLKKIASYKAEVVAALRDDISIEDLRDICLLYTSPSPRDATLSRMPSSA